MKFKYIFAAAVALAVCAAGASRSLPPQTTFLPPPDSIRYIDPLREYCVVGLDTVRMSFHQHSDSLQHPGPLTDDDFRELGALLGVEPAAMKAVVEIEAGRTHEGFWSEGKPLVSFDLPIYKRMAARRGINTAKYTASHPAVFTRPSIAKYGSQQAAVQARIDQAMSIDSVSAIEGTFWGMFQIGGFNWKRCGADSPQDFYRRMSRSERDQLELFCEFITRTGLLPALKNKNWATFARGYNGPSYAARGYHTKLAAAYNKFKNKT